MFRFLGVFSGISVLLCGTTFYIFKKRLGLSSFHNRLLAIFFIFIAVVMVLGPVVYRSSHRSVDSFGQTVFQFTQYFLMGWVAMNFMLFSVLEFLQVITKPFDSAKRIFLTEGLTRGIVAGTTLAAFGGLFEAVTKPNIVPVTIKLKTLPKSFDGATIAQISDIHIGPLLHKDFLDGVVNQVMSLNADMIFITGDLVDGTVDQLKDQMGALQRLKAKEGVYFCTGNHEFYSGVAEWIDYLEGIGIHVFKNTNVVLNRKSADGKEEKLLVAGVHDWQGDKTSEEYRSDCEAAAKTDEQVSCKILMAHNPFSIVPAAAAGFNFQASGHTHAGQFYPFVFLVKLKLKHSEGWYQINDSTQLYVNRGTGYWGPPNRLGKHSEITHFTLRSRA